MLPSSKVQDNTNNSFKQTTSNNNNNNNNEEIDESKLIVESLQQFLQSIKSTPKDIFESNNDTSNENNDDNDNDESGDEKDCESKKNKDRTFDMILNIIERSVYFLSTNDINAQVFDDIKNNLSILL